jgi:hypothetical protein
LLRTAPGINIIGNSQEGSASVLRNLKKRVGVGFAAAGVLKKPKTKEAFRRQKGGRGVREWISEVVTLHRNKDENILERKTIREQTLSTENR